MGGVPRHWTRAEYYHMAKAGVFGSEERVELIEGEIISRMPPQLMPHIVAIRLIGPVLRDVFGRQFSVESQLPISLGDDSEPEPDFVVVPEPARVYLSRNVGPMDVQLLIEVSDSTLSFDRGRKARLYAKHGIADYWIVNLVDRCVEVRRDPDVEVGYRTIHIAKPDDVIEPLSAPGKGVRVADLLP